MNTNRTLTAAETRDREALWSAVLFNGPRCAEAGEYARRFGRRDATGTAGTGTGVPAAAGSGRVLFLHTPAGVRQVPFVLGGFGAGAAAEADEWADAKNIRQK